MTDIINKKATCTTHNPENWDAHYRSRIGETYPVYCRQQYRKFLDTLRAYINVNISVFGNCHVREEGCGIGTITKILAQDADHSRTLFTAFDVNPQQVENTKANLRSLNVIPNVYQGSHFDNHGKCDIIHAHGVLEHFSDEDITRVIKRQLNEAYCVVHYVPLSGWGDVGSYGDERLLPIEHWVTTHKPDEYCTFNNGKDAVLVWYNC